MYAELISGTRFFWWSVIFCGWFKREIEMIEHDRRSSQMVWFGSKWHETIGEFLWYLERPSRREMGCRGCNGATSVAFCILSAQVCCCYSAKKAMIITATCWHQHCSGTICSSFSGHEWQVCFDPWPDDTGIWKIRDARSRLFDVLRSSQLLAPVPAFFPACRHVLPTSVLALTGWWLLHLQLGSYRWTQWPSCHSRCQPWIFKSCGLTSFGQMQFWSEGWSCKSACNGVEGRRFSNT